MSSTRSRIPTSPFPPERPPTPRPHEGARSVVDHADQQDALLLVEPDVDRRPGPGVTEHVREALLDDTEGRHLLGRREPFCADLDRHVHAQPGGPRAFGDDLDLVEGDQAPWRVAVGGARVPLAQHPDDAVHVVDRVPARGGDRPQRGLRHVRRLPQHGLGAVGLKDHHGQAVRHHVVQFTGDLGAFPGRRQPHALLLFPLDVPGAGRLALGVEAPRVQGEGRQPDRQRQPPEDQERFGIDERLDAEKRHPHRPGRRGEQHHGAREIRHPGRPGVVDDRHHGEQHGHVVRGRLPTPVGGRAVRTGRTGRRPAPGRPPSPCRGTVGGPAGTAPSARPGAGRTRRRSTPPPPGPPARYPGRRPGRQRVRTGRTAPSRATRPGPSSPQPTVAPFSSGRSATGPMAQVPSGGEDFTMRATPSCAHTASARGGSGVRSGCAGRQADDTGRTSGDRAPVRADAAVILRRW